MHFHTLLHTLSCNFHAISHNLGYISHFGVNFNMFGIKKHVLKLTNSLVILGKAVGLQKGKRPQKGAKGLKSGLRAALCKS